MPRLHKPTGTKAVVPLCFGKITAPANAAQDYFFRSHYDDPWTTASADAGLAMPVAGRVTALVLRFHALGANGGDVGLTKNDVDTPLFVTYAAGSDQLHVLTGTSSFVAGDIYKLVVNQVTGATFELKSAAMMVEGV